MKIITNLLFSFILLLLTALPVAAQQGMMTSQQGFLPNQKELSSPLYLGFILVDEPTIESMSKVCDYYGLQAIPTTDGYTTYKHEDGTIFRFKQSDDRTEGMDGRLLEIQTLASQKEIDKALKNLAYKKTGSAKVTVNTDATDGSPVKTVPATIYDQGTTLARIFLRAYVTSFKPHTITFRYIDTQQ